MEHTYDQSTPNPLTYDPTVADMTDIKYFDQLPFEPSGTGVGAEALAELHNGDEELAKIASAIAKLEEIRQIRGNAIGTLFRGNKEAQEWLTDNNYPNYKTAERALNAVIEPGIHPDRDLYRLGHASIRKMRRQFTDLSVYEKERADAHLRHEGLPKDLVDECDRSSGKRGPHRNLIDWLMLSSNENHNGGATPEQAEAIVRWNAEHMDQLAADKRRISQYVQLYAKGVDRAVAARELDQNFAESQLAIKRVVVGDMLDRDFLLGENASRRPKSSCRYDYRSHTLHVWPYELPGLISQRDILLDVSREVTLSRTDAIPNAMAHERDEPPYASIIAGYAARFAMIAIGQDPRNPKARYATERRMLQRLHETAQVPDLLTDATVSKYFVRTGQHDRAVHKLHDVYDQAYRRVRVLGLVNAACNYPVREKPWNNTVESAAFGLEAGALTVKCLQEHARKGFQHPEMAAGIARTLQEAADNAPNASRKHGFSYAASIFNEIDERWHRNGNGKLDYET